eukprot:TRINITY_DN4112_c0_g1_i1.p1 TRINITY_DN4112_c0_g1~~TRINITY_DN4112_c0_g1_i1.p1  ORF type:complete len:581 (-),score=107.67 TRINITY_DN4112_c0_g1_i1:52-1794(-)
MIDAVSVAYLAVSGVNTLMVLILIPLYTRELTSGRNQNLLRLRRPRLAITQALALSLCSVMVAIRFQRQQIMSCTVWLVLLHLSALLALISLCARAVLIYLRFWIQKDRHKYVPRALNITLKKQSLSESLRSPLRTPLSGYDDPDMVLSSPLMLRPWGYFPAIFLTLGLLMIPIVRVVIIHQNTIAGAFPSSDACGASFGGTAVVTDTIIVASIGFVLSAVAMAFAFRLSENLWIRPELIVEYLHLLIPFIVTMFVSGITTLSQLVDQTYALYVVCLPILSHNWICLGEIVRRARRSTISTMPIGLSNTYGTNFHFSEALCQCCNFFSGGRSAQRKDSSKRSQSGIKESRPVPVIPWSNVIEEFLLMLDDPEGVAMVEDFLQKELSVENLLFYLEATNFQRKFDTRTPEDRLLKAKRIALLYISMDGRYCINIPGELREGIMRIMLPILKPKGTGVGGGATSGTGNSSGGVQQSAASILKQSALAILGQNNSGSSLRLETGPAAVGQQQDEPLCQTFPLEKILFEDARQEILELMVKDSFNRLRTTPQYCEFYYKKHPIPPSRVNTEEEGAGDDDKEVYR